MCEVPSSMSRIDDPETQEERQIRDLLDALHAALRWIDNDYRNHINNDNAYEAMMVDDTIGQSYKDDITLIRIVKNEEKGA